MASTLTGLQDIGPLSSSYEIYVVSSGSYPGNKTTLGALWASGSEASGSQSASYSSFAENAQSSVSSSYSVSADTASYGSPGLSSSYADFAEDTEASVSSSYSVSADTASFIPSTQNLDVASVTSSTSIQTSQAVSWDLGAAVPSSSISPFTPDTLVTIIVDGQAYQLPASIVP